MAKLCFSVAGEGRGHASRASALLRKLTVNYEVIVFASGQAYKMLKPLERHLPVQVHALEALAHAYQSCGTVHVAKTLQNGWRYYMKLPELVPQVAEVIEREKPDLAIVDFEPVLPRACERVGLPYVSVNHQHVLVAGDHSVLPFRIGLHAHWMGLFIPLMYRRQQSTIISSFYQMPLREKWRDRATQVGVLLRPAIASARATVGDHLVVYARRQEPPGLLEAIERSGLPAIVYGIGCRPAAGRIEFRDVHEEDFIEQLASSRALVTTAGNQIVGEALYLGKPIFAFPEHKNYEQYVNAFFLNQTGCGRAVGWRDCDTSELQSFLEAYPGGCFQDAANWRWIDGTPAVVSALEKELGLLPVRNEAPQTQQVAAL